MKKPEKNKDLKSWTLHSGSGLMKAGGDTSASSSDILTRKESLPAGLCVQEGIVRSHEEEFGLGGKAFEEGGAAPVFPNRWNPGLVWMQVLSSFQGEGFPAG